MASISGGALVGIEGKIEPAPAISGDAGNQALPSLPMDCASMIDTFRHVQSVFANGYKPCWSSVRGMN